MMYDNQLFLIYSIYKFLTFHGHYKHDIYKYIPKYRVFQNNKRSKSRGRIQNIYSIALLLDTSSND